MMFSKKFAIMKSEIQYYKSLFKIRRELNWIYKKPCVLFFSHDLSRSGAPILLLNIVKSMAIKMNIKPILLTLKSGELFDDFFEIACVINLEQEYMGYIHDERYIKDLLKFFKSAGVEKALLNTAAGGLLIPILEECKFNYLLLIHELPRLITQMEWDLSVIPEIRKYQDQLCVIFSSEYSYDLFTKYFQINLKKIVMPQGVMMDHPVCQNNSTKSLHEDLNVNKDCKIILGAGKDFYRKGIDLFYNIAELATAINRNLLFIWSGDLNDPRVIEITSENNNKNIRFINFTADYIKLFRGADLFILTSREDAFPNVVLDALNCGVPVVAYKDCGGSQEILEKLNLGLLVEKDNNQEFVGKILYWLDENNIDQYKDISTQAQQLIENDYNFAEYIDKLIEHLK